MEKLFADDDEYLLFLDKLSQHLEKVKVCAYCLIPNHFHLLLFVPDDIPEPATAVPEMLRQAFKEYAQAVNFRRGRSGNLMRKPFRRIHVDTEAYAMSLIHYIHYNPTHHGITADWREWRWSSWAQLDGTATGIVDKNAALDIFGGVDKLRQVHDMLSDYRSVREFLIEVD
jgi:REP element-mobilizing transposase RayT